MADYAGRMRDAAIGLACLASFALAGCATRPALAVTATSTLWTIEAEQPSRVDFGEVIDIDAPAGLSLWYARELVGPVAIEFEAMAVYEGGANDEVSDLNAFWMARDPSTKGGSVLAAGRSGAFSGYDDLETYYVGIGGNRNSTTRFRRYIGRAGDRPLLPEHDLGDAANLLIPNRWTHIRLVADGQNVAVERDGRRLFTIRDPAPYTRGWFALRTTKSHIRVRKLRIGKP